MTPAAIPADVNRNAEALSKPRDGAAATERRTPAEKKAGLDPAAARCLEPAPDLAAAQACTRNLAHSHYENFSVVSILLPRHLREDFCNIYAFCRIADDLGDELG